MTTQNWPDPERPGYPMFPEQSGMHILKQWKQCSAIWWDANLECWFFDGVEKQPATTETVARRYSYAMVCLLPGQITQLLAAERERAATAIDQLKNEERGLYATGLMTTRAEITIRALASAADEIRNLGDAP